MKSKAIAVTVMLALGAVSAGLAQGPDLKKTRQELEIMKGILETTIGFVLRDIRQREAGAKASTQSPGRHYGSSDIDAFYLHGQGAVFIISTSALRFRIYEGVQPAIADLIGLEADAYRVQAEAYRAAVEAQQDALRAVEAAQAGLARGARPQVPPEPPAPPKPPEAAPAPPPTPPAPGQEELRKKLYEAQEKVKQRQEELKARQKKIQEYLEEISAHLIEALANHGDSMTTLRPGEYINLVITGGDTLGLARYAPADEDAAAPYRIIAVQKSVIADYKAGRFTLEDFKRRVLQYAM